MTNYFASLYTHAAASVLQFLSTEEIVRMRAVNKHLQVIADDPISWKYTTKTINWNIYNSNVAQIHTFFNCATLGIYNSMHMYRNMAIKIINTYNNNREKLWLDNFDKYTFNNLTSLYLKDLDPSSTSIRALRNNAKKLTELHLEIDENINTKCDSNLSFQDEFYQLLVHGNLTNLNIGKTFNPDMITAMTNGLVNSKIETLACNPFKLYNRSFANNNEINAQFQIQDLLTEIEKMTTLKTLNFLNKNHMHEYMDYTNWIIHDNSYIASLTTSIRVDWGNGRFENLRELVFNSPIFDPSFIEHIGSFQEWLQNSKLEKLALLLRSTNLELDVEDTDFTNLLNIVAMHGYITEFTVNIKTYDIMRTYDIYKYAQINTDMFKKCNSLKLLCFNNLMLSPHNQSRQKKVFKILDHNPELCIRITNENYNDIVEYHAKM